MTPELRDQFIQIVGSKYALTQKDDLTHFTHEARGDLTGETELVLKPANREEVSQIVKLATMHKISIVPQGGHTGMCGGGMPMAEQQGVVVCLSRMVEVRNIDIANSTMTLEAGITLQKAQEIAEEHDRFFPLSLGSQGSCMIGGNVSTNAGGTGVLAYGNMRDLVMGLEVVLPNGEIWNGLNTLRKNNTGYDLKNLFIGAEGTLGIITGVVLKLFPRPVGNEVAFVAFNSVHQALEFFKTARNQAGSQLTGFELIPRVALDLVLRHLDQYQDPLAQSYPWYGLVQLSSLKNIEDAHQIMTNVLEDAFEGERIIDAAIAANIEQQRTFWEMRENISYAQKLEGAYVAHDVSVPIARIPELIDRGEVVMQEALAHSRMIAYGHMGDGNIHFNCFQPEGMDRDEFKSHRKAIQDAVYGLALELGGSISAEHGIGLIKVDRLANSKSDVEMAMMRTIKQGFDPNNIMNPGKVLAL